MANKRLNRVRGLPQENCAELAKHDVLLCKDVLTKNILELMSFGLDYNESKFVFDSVSKSVAPNSSKVSDLLEKKQQWFLSTQLAKLDQCLHGGLTSGTITELTGPPGCGKTQFCMMLASLTIMSLLSTDDLDSCVIYIDTENAFTAKRLLEISSCHLGENQTSHLDVEEIASNVVVFYESTFQEMLTRLESLETIIIERNVKLIIVDSIASLARKEFGGHNLVTERNNMLMKEATLLKYFAERFNIPVLVTNQVTTSTSSELSKDSCLIAALGNTWAHAVNTRLMIRHSNEDHSIRELLVAKSPLCPLSKFLYKIDASGIVQVDDLTI